MWTRWSCQAQVKVMVGSLQRSMRLLYMMVVSEGMKEASNTSQSFLVQCTARPCSVSRRLGMRVVSHAGKVSTCFL